MDYSDDEFFDDVDTAGRDSDGGNGSDGGHSGSAHRGGSAHSGHRSAHILGSDSADNGSDADSGAASDADMASEGERSDGSDGERSEGSDHHDFFANMNFRDRSFADVISRLVGGSVLQRDSSEMDGLLGRLTQREDPFVILETLNELSERLLMMNGITAERVIPAGRLAAALVALMSDPQLADQLELQLVACRCLYNFLEVNQDFIHDVIAANAVEVLCRKLAEISYIDLTEQALQTLEMVSRDPVAHGAIIANNGLGACLQYLDFLTVHSQRKCLLIVANCCADVSAASFAAVDGVFDSIAAVVAHSDRTVVENAWLAISRIVIAYRTQPRLLEQLFLSRGDLLRQLADVVVVSAKPKSDSASVTPVSFNTCVSLVKSLITLVAASVGVCGLLLGDIRLGASIVSAINRYAKSERPDGKTLTSASSNDNIASEAIMAAPNELLSQFLNLIGYLLPVSYTPQETPFLKNSYEDAEPKAAINAARIASYRDAMAVPYWRFVNDVWSFLINCYQGSMDFEVRRKSLVCIFRVTKFCGAADFASIQGVDLISGLLGSIINQSKAIVLKQFEAADADMSLDDEPKKNEDTFVKLNSNLLLLESFLIGLNLLRTAPGMFLEPFEKEGIVSDVRLVLGSLRAAKVGLDTAADPEQPRPFSSNFSNKFLDVELTKDYEYKLSSDKIYSKMVHVADTIVEVYTEYKNNSIDSESSSASVISEIKSALSEQSAAYSHDQWVALWTKLEDAFKNISSFELISSGIIEVLVGVFSSNLDGSSPGYAAFLAVFFGNDAASAKLVVSKLQDALTRTESFEVISAGGASSNTQLRFPIQYENSQTAGMAKQIKLKLGIENDVPNLPSAMQNLVLSVHAIATFKSIGTFLKIRLKMFDGLSRAGFRAEDEEIEDEDKIAEDIDHEDSDTEEPKTENKYLDDMEFVINGEVIPNDTSIYGAIYRSLQTEPDEIVESNRIWGAIHSVTLRKKDGEYHEEEQRALYKVDGDVSELDSYDATTTNILKLLKILFVMNQQVDKSNAPCVPADGFMNWKLTVKLNRQLEEPLIVASGTLPGWSIHITRLFPFIFPLDTRIFFLSSTSFGYSRLINQWQIRTNQENNENVSNNLRVILGRPLRHKVRISRKMMLQSAMKVLGLYGSTPGILEIEYFDEVGSGLGPTLEFYSTVSQEFCKRKLHLWRDDRAGADDESYVDVTHGLFPSPLDTRNFGSKNRAKVMYLLTTLGKFVARALLDSRIIDFQFNELFLQLVQLLNQKPISEVTTSEIRQLASLATLRTVDPELASSMERLLEYDSVEDLALTYTLPGYPQYELMAHGEMVAVDRGNVQQYVQDVVEATLYYGVVHKVKAFMDGFSTVFPVSSLVVFSAGELVNLFGNAHEDWSYDTLVAAINANHGYNKDSPAIQTLVEILVGFSEGERRAFLQFLTGAPKLPIGGFKALRPELTVVRKHAEAPLKDDDYLPSVMTCANYLKLPNYSRREVMRAKLLQAIRDGAGAFHLS